MVLAAFEYKTYDRNVNLITVTMETPPALPEMPLTPVLSDAIESVEDDIVIEEDVFIDTEDDGTFAIEIRLCFHQHGRGSGRRRDSPGHCGRKTQIHGR